MQVVGDHFAELQRNCSALNEPALARFDQSTLPIICPGVLISMREENKADLAFGIFPTRTNSSEPRHKPCSDAGRPMELLGSCRM